MHGPIRIRFMCMCCYAYVLLRINRVICLEKYILYPTNSYRRTQLLYVRYGDKALILKEILASKNKRKCLLHGSSQYLKTGYRGVP